MGQKLLPLSQVRTILILFSLRIILTYRYVHQQMHIKGLKTVRNFQINRTCFDATASPSGIPDTKVNKHEYISLGSTITNITYLLHGAEFFLRS